MERRRNHQPGRDRRRRGRLRRPAFGRAGRVGVAGHRRDLRRRPHLVLYVPNGRKIDDPHYDYKLDWLARLKDTAGGWLGDDAALVGDWNIAPQDEDVFDMAASPTTPT